MLPDNVGVALACRGQPQNALGNIYRRKIVLFREGLINEQFIKYGAKHRDRSRVVRHIILPVAFQSFDY